MTNEKLEQCLAQALEKTAPHDVDGVLSRCEKRKGTEIPMKTKPHSLKKWMAMAACLALLLLCGGGLFLRQANAVASVVSIDVNPSIELRVNQNEKVLACVPMNDDAHAILADMGDGEDLKGAKLDVAVNAIVGSLVRNGYLESISSAIMISVEDRDQSRAHRLQQDLSAAVDGILRDSASQASVLTQTVTQDTSLEKQAKDHHISTGKAALVNRILALNNSLSFEELSRLSIGELKDLAETGAPAMPIGMERALEIALLTCGQSADQLTKQEVDAELDEVPAHYEVELEDRSGTEYEYRIDAYTGAVLTSYVEPDGHDDADGHDDHYDDDHDDDDDDDDTYCVSATIMGEAPSKCKINGVTPKYEQCGLKKGASYSLTSTSESGYNTSWSSKSGTISGNVSETLECNKDDDEKCYAITVTGDTENCPVTLPAGNCKADKTKYTLGSYEYTVKPKEGYVYEKSADPVSKKVWVTGDSTIEIKDCKPATGNGKLEIWVHGGGNMPWTSWSGDLSFKANGTSIGSDVFYGYEGSANPVTYQKEFNVPASVKAGDTVSAEVSHVEYVQTGCSGPACSDSGTTGRCPGSVSTSGTVRETSDGKLLVQMNFNCSANSCTPKLTNTYVLKTDPYDQDQEVTMVSFTWYYNVSCNGTLNPCKRLTVHGCVNNSSNCYYSTTGTNVCKSGSWSSTAGFPAGTKFGDIYFEVRENGQKFTGDK